MNKTRYKINLADNFNPQGIERILDSQAEWRMRRDEFLTRFAPTRFKGDDPSDYS